MPFQLVYGDLVGPFKPTARGGYEFVGKITDQFTKWSAIYLLCSKDQALASLQLFFTSIVTPLRKRRVGQTLCGMVRCMDVDGGLPPFLWGELMMTASYLCDRIPHSAHKMETPHKMLYGKDADFSHLRIIGERALVRINDGTKFGHMSWE